MGGIQACPKTLPSTCLVSVRGLAGSSAKGTIPAALGFHPGKLHTPAVPVDG